MRLAARILYSLWASRITGQARHGRARRSGAGIVGPRERRRGGSAGAKPPGSFLECADMPTDADDVLIEAATPLGLVVRITRQRLGLRHHREASDHGWALLFYKAEATKRTPGFSSPPTQLTQSRKAIEYG